MNGSVPLIDFHAHILPGADHGSSGLEESLNQLALIQAAGVDTVVATPHFYPHRHTPEEFLQLTASAAEKLKAHKDSLPRICLGAEVLYCAHLDEMEGLERLCVQGTDVLLLELPMDVWGRELFETVELLLKRFTVVLAHIDRYIREQKADIEQLLALGALAQINGSALFSFAKRHKLRSLLEGDSVVALGSDLHGTNKIFYQQFLGAQKRLGETHSAIMQRAANLLKTAIPL